MEPDTVTKTSTRVTSFYVSFYKEVEKGRTHMLNDVSWWGCCLRVKVWLPGEHMPWLRAAVCSGQLLLPCKEPSNSSREARNPDLLCNLIFKQWQLIQKLKKYILLRMNKKICRLDVACWLPKEYLKCPKLRNGWPLESSGHQEDSIWGSVMGRNKRRSSWFPCHLR